MGLTRIIRTRFKQGVNRLLKGRVRDILSDSEQINRICEQIKSMCDDDAAFGQSISLLQMREKLPPLPPKELQIRIAGAYYPEFFQHGRDMFGDIEKLLQTQGLSAFNCERIRDFGCGCGRFLIPLSYQMPPGRLSGTDIDEQAIQWLQENYPGFHDLNVNGFVPPIKYADGTFDLVYSISIFTHLPEGMQHAWLPELPGSSGPADTECSPFTGKSSFPP